ncbi:MAG: hypothetical protein IKI11_06805 [Neisseriaceae bacterium]|nr:hypothetical protein [Neisseriaceae bacterium]
MKVQVITDSNLRWVMNYKISNSHWLESQNLKFSSLSDLQSPDEFDINLIDLSSENLWCHNYSETTSINRIKDIQHISQMVMRKKKSIVIYILPHNTNYRYNKYRDDYYQKENLKNLPDLIKFVCNSATPKDNCIQNCLVHENTTTKIAEQEYKASFFFDEQVEPLTKSQCGEKPTTISFGNDIYHTTLDVLKTKDKLDNFLKYLFPDKSIEEKPEWIKEIKILNDEKLLNTIEECKQEISKLNNRIADANNQLQENERIKSILYSNGEQLVEVVFSILEKIFSYNLNEFVDKKKEDFIIKKEKYTIIGEIKGITSNIKNEHISQTDVHYQGYMDKIQEEGKKENIYQVLIINPLRNKPVNEREPVHETQINLANRNHCLIIETKTLLKLYEKFVAGKISVEDCEKLFTEKQGLLKDDDLIIK